MSECFIVVHRNYAEGTDAYAFWTEKWAKKSVNEDVNTEFTSLCNEGYNPIILRRPSGATVYVNDTDIYYEWEILKTTIEGEMPPLGSRDKELEELWAEFSDVSMDPETECMDEPFLGFPAGTHREDIWHWFDERHTLGVAYLLNGQSAKGLNPLMLWKDDFVQEHAWDTICEALGVNTSSTEVEVKCIVCVAK